MLSHSKTSSTSRAGAQLSQKNRNLGENRERKQPEMKKQPVGWRQVGMCIRGRKKDRWSNRKGKGLEKEQEINKVGIITRLRCPARPGKAEMGHKRERGASAQCKKQLVGCFKH
jgi:hypothetical protein